MRDSARVLGYPYVGRRQDRQADAAARDGPRHPAPCVPRRGRGLRRRFQDGVRAPCALRSRSRRETRDRRRTWPRRAPPPRRHPRRRGRDRARAAHRVPADPAQAGGGDRDRRLARRHAVRDARRRRPRAAQDGLPRAAQPRRHRDRARPRRALHRCAPRHRSRRPRGRQDVRAAPAGRHHRRVPARRWADAHAAPLTPPDVVRGRRRAGRALPPGSDGHEHAQRLRRPQERAEAGHLLPPRPRGGARAHVRADGLPRAADARRATARGLLARGGRPTPVRGGQEEARPHAPRELEVRRRMRRAGAHRAVRRADVRPSSSRSPTTRSRRPTPPATASSRTRPRT